MGAGSKICFVLVLICSALFSGSSAHAQTVIASSGRTVATSQSGQQILFRDKTSISAGANTTLKIKRANYDEGTGTGDVVIEVTKGAFRYVTGDQAGSHTVKTPLATVGVRGTVIEGYVDVNGYEVFVLIEGAFETCSRVICQQVTEPGSFVVVKPDGSISPPQPLTAALRDAMLLVVPSVDLLLQHFSEIVDRGGDPLVRFRDINDALKGQDPLPPPPVDDGDGGGDGDGHGHGHGHGYGHGGGEWPGGGDGHGHGPGEGEGHGHGHGEGHGHGHGVGDDD